MQMLIVWGLLTIAVAYFVTFLYVTAQAMIGHRFGIDVEVVCVGYDFFGAGLKRQGKHWEWRLGLFPLGGYTKFRNDYEAGDIATEVFPIGREIPTVKADWHDDASLERTFGDLAPVQGDSSGLFQDAPSLLKICIALVGPIIYLAFGLMLIAAPVLMREFQLQHRYRTETEIWPTALGGLVLVPAPSTMSGQLELVQSIGVESVNKYILFRPLDGWGGPVGTALTCGASGRHAAHTWMTLVGALVLLMGLYNLIPLPVLNGGNVVITLVEWVIRRPIRESRPMVFATFCGLIVALIVFGRLLVADAIWIWNHLF
jgi:membrane-associated protease RseP (regulator of RpoE activity)